MFIVLRDARSEVMGVVTWSVDGRLECRPGRAGGTPKDTNEGVVEDLCGVG